jgi:nucleoredoxin
MVGAHARTAGGDPQVLAADPSLWPAKIKTTTVVTRNFGKLAPGTKVAMYTLNSTGPDIIWPNSSNRLILPSGSTDIFQCARRVARIDRDHRPSRIAAALKGITLDSNGRPYADPDPDVKKLYALYFGAIWCAPCHAFSPDLVKYLNDAMPKHRELGAVFLSEDKQVGPMLEYMKEEGMPFPAVPPDALAKSPILMSFAARMIPQLVIVDRFGTVLATNEDQKGNRGDPKDTIGELDRLLSASSVH